mmetsp:Transcript_51878/g.151021  ORF Transcript_51878/g.151021 Transcript_51878/m.151021 type:complete len:217 (+) Transcript_51878:1643-2293(+)
MLRPVLRRVLLGHEGQDPAAHQGGLRAYSCDRVHREARRLEPGQGGDPHRRPRLADKRRLRHRQGQHPTDASRHDAHRLVVVAVRFGRRLHRQEGRVRSRLRVPDVVEYFVVGRDCNPGDRNACRRRLHRQGNPTEGRRARPASGRARRSCRAHEARGKVHRGLQEDNDLVVAFPLREGRPYRDDRILRALVLHVRDVGVEVLQTLQRRQGDQCPL